MKKSLRLLLITLILLSVNPFHSQNVTQLGNEFTESGSQHGNEIFTNALGTPFFAFLNIEDLLVYKYINNSWELSDSSLPIISGNVDQMDIEYNHVTDEIFLIYIKNNNLYYRKYSSGWSGETQIPSPFNVTTCHLSLDTNNNLAYISFQGVWTELEMRTYDIQNSNLTTISTPPNFANSSANYKVFEMKYYNDNDILYLISSSVLDSVYLSVYDGINWTTGITQLSNDRLNRAKIAFDPSNQYGLDIIIATVGNNLSGYPFQLRAFTPGFMHYNMIPYNYPNSNGNSITLNSLVVNPINNYYAYTYQMSFAPGNTSIIEYYDGTNWTEFDHGMPSARIIDMHFDVNGNLLLSTINANGKPVIYKVDLFYTSIETNTSTKFSIYPNPSNEWITIDNNGNAFESANIFDISGKIVLSINDEKTIDISELPNSIYIIEINTENGSKYSRFVKN